MKFSDYYCNNCNRIFEITVINHLDSFPVNPMCPTCGSLYTQRKYSNINFDIATGKLGNSKDGFNNGFVDHPSSMMGKQKGKKIKTIK